MPRNSKLNDAQKNRVVELFQAQVKQTDIAKYFSVHPRTINRVLIEKGLVASPEEKERNRNQILKLCEERGLTADSLRARLDSPLLTVEAIRHVLGNLEPGQLGVLLHSSIKQSVLQQLQRREHGVPERQEALPV